MGRPRCHKYCSAHIQMMLKKNKLGKILVRTPANRHGFDVKGKLFSVNENELTVS